MQKYPRQFGEGMRGLIMTKKIISLLMVIVCFFAFTIPAFSSQNNMATVYADNISGTAGEYIDVPIKIADNNGLMGFSINIEYDADVLTPISVETGAITSNGGMENSIETSKINRFLVTWYSSENITDNGVLFTIRFQISGTAMGTTEIGLSYNQPDTFNEDWEDVIFECGNIIVSIANSSLENSTRLWAENIVAIAGEEFELIISAKNVSLCDSFTYELLIANEKYSYVSCNSVQGKVSVTENTHSIVITWNSFDETVIDGTLFTIRFKTEEYTSYECNIIPTLISSSSAVTFLDFSITITNPHENEPAQIYINNTNANIGKTVEIPILIKNNHGIMGFVFDIQYDTSVFTLQNITRDSSINNGFFDYNESTSGIITVVWSGTQNITANGELFIISFTVNDDATAWTESTINLSYDQTQTFDEYWNVVALEMSNVSINIVLLGDVNKDGILDEKDYNLVVEESALKTNLSVEQKMIADLNSDNAVDGFDAIILELMIIGNI